eukprot:552566_1
MMELLLKYRLLGSELRENEFLLLMQKIIESTGSEPLLSYIFNHFHQQHLLNKTSTNELQNIVNIMSNMIESRQQEPEMSNSNSICISLPHKIDALPSQWIAEVASYLPLKDYLNFSKCNRTIYIASHCPCTLNACVRYPYEPSGNFHLNPIFKSLKRVYFWRPVLNHINTIQFNGIKELDIAGWNYQHQIKLFMESKCINFSNIEILTVIHSTFDLLLPLFRKCKNLRHLSLCDVKGIQQIDESTVAQLLPKLQIIDINYNTNDIVTIFTNYMIKTHNDIRSLRIFDESDTETFICKNLSNLSEIFVTQPSLKIMNDIICIAVNLRKISFTYDWKGHESNAENEVKTMIVSSLTKCKQLEFLHVDAKYLDALCKIVEYIEIGLFKSKHMKRKRLVIEIEAQEIHDISNDKLSVYASRIVHSLESSEIENFMFKYYFSFNDEDEEGQRSLVDGFSKRYLTFAGEIFAQSSFPNAVMIIANKNCAINGFTERWINKNYTWEY